MIAEPFPFVRSLARASLLCLFMLLSLTPSTSTAAQSARELKEVKVAYPPSMASVTLMTGIKQRFFDEQGLRVWNRDMTVDPAAIRNVLDDASDARAKSADPKRFYDNSLIQQVNRDHAAKLFPGEIR